MAESYKKYSEEEAREAMEKILKVGFAGAKLVGKLACKGIHYATRPKSEEDEYPNTKLGKIRQTIHNITEIRDDCTNYSDFKKAMDEAKTKMGDIQQASLDRKEEIQNKINTYGFLSVADCLSCRHRWVELGKQVDASFCPKCKEANKNKILVREINNAEDLYAPIGGLQFRNS